MTALYSFSAPQAAKEVTYEEADEEEQMEHSTTFIGGYDLKFVSSPPDDLLCLICMFPAREALQNTCCGKIFCKNCINKYKERKKECPNCRDTQGNQFPDRRSEW